ncbi:TPA: glycosyltransferase family 2 protein [Photobacterium damselae]
MKNLKKRVSIITPIYNEEKNINMCYQQVINQSYENIEWVVIDDGSTDSSLELLEDLALNNSSKNIDIKVISQDNKGAALARKNGILNASGEYCSILDCDDLLSPDSITLAVNEIIDNDEIDIVCFNVNYITDSTITSKFNYSHTSWPISGKVAFGSTIDSWGLSGWFFFKKEVMLRAIDSYDNQLGNNINDDEILTRLCFYHSRYVTLCDGTYGYVNNASSTTKKVNCNYYKVLNTALFLHRFIKTNTPEYNKLNDKHLVSVMWGILYRILLWNKKISNFDLWVVLLDKTSKELSFNQLLKNKNTGSVVKYLIIKAFLLSRC